MPKTYPLMHGFATATNRVATFEACTNMSKLAFLKDLTVKGQRITPFSAWLEMMQEASSVLCAKSMNDTLILQNIVVGTTRDYMQSKHTMLCSINTISGHASISDASGGHISAMIVKHTREVSNITGAPCSNNIILAPKFADIETFTESTFAEIFLQRDAFDFVAHPRLIQSSLTLPQIPSRISSFVSCATIAIEDTSDNIYCTGLSNKTTLCKHHQDLMCTKKNGQACLRFCEVQMEHLHKPATGNSELPTLSLKWQPSAMLAFTQRSCTYPAPLRWIIFSEMPHRIGDLCNGIDQPVMVITVVFNGHGSHCPFGLHLCNEDDLVYFLSLVTADNCLLVRSLHEDSCLNSKSSADFAMLWVYRAYARTLANMKMSFVNIKERKGNALSEISLSQGRVLADSLILTMWRLPPWHLLISLPHHMNTQSPNCESCIIA